MTALRKLTFSLGLLALTTPSTHAAPETSPPEKPNIVFLFCDDFGYGDIQHLNPEKGKILTPHLDALAKSGMVFTDAHSGSSVCTPTRYGLLTGRYSWRTKLQSGVVQGFQPNLIAPDRPTVASFLQDHGYHTALFGKWHLNFLYTDPDTGKELSQKNKRQPAPVGSKIPDGPLTRGFDRFHGIHHAGSMKGIIEGDTVVKHEDEVNFLPRLTREAVKYINERAQNNQADKKQPFFLYLPYGSPHTPIVPSPEWQGKSGINDYADFVMQNDHSVGQIVKALKDNGLTENTLIIFSSDNGCSKAANFKQLNAKGHFPSAHMRGSKADLWDGGHRVPFLASWPAKIKAGSTNDTLLCLTDFFATTAEILGSAPPVTSCEDSVSFFPAFTGADVHSDRKLAGQALPTRTGIIHHSVSGHFGYRKDNWKLLLAKGSGGWSSPQERDLKKTDTPKAQLYDLNADPAETNNLYLTQPAKAEELLQLLTQDVTAGRSTPGPASANDTSKINLWKNK